MLNVIALMGRLTAEPELKHTPNGVAACKFRIAVDRNIVTWRKAAEFVCKYFGKGSLVAVNGSLQTRSYEDKNGNRRTAYEVVADNVHFAGEKTESKPKPFGPATTPVDINSGPDDFAVIDSEEDLPF